jgi:ribosomal protein L31E
LFVLKEFEKKILEKGNKKIRRKMKLIFSRLGISTLGTADG